ncbi:Lysosome membrane protein 2 85 kDa lysosomal membrane sialoglycoprotein [Collichthys lucidus]|uniref:Lysosome membrane protein 2 85 kDa lysosomal membrane sialoglycoprotein n=1 Tax=Collichthys lucidus TaxID=240159 RepID=A0A4U5VAP8_COLLU|nr:Lysosome membrane protein 2 85 kDa lysosomal membrane sialoglycoprotein [Collichthys lucidus]
MLLKSCCIYGTGVVSILMLILGISLVLSNVFPHFVQSLVTKEIILKNGTEAFEAWENPPAPIYMQFYFFNLTNPLEVLDGDRPAVVEIGPYTYREYRPMEQVNFQDNGTKVTAVNTKTYIFQPDMSRGPESDLIRTVNIPAMGTGQGLFTTRTVGELLWGYEDGLLKALKIFDPELDDVFGLFHKNNASNDGEYVFYTGQQNYKDFARVDTWNGESSLNWWTSDECNMINGTNGASFHPAITKDETLYMFSSDLCRLSLMMMMMMMMMSLHVYPRDSFGFWAFAFSVSVCSEKVRENSQSLYALYEGDVTVKQIPGYRFSPPSEVFANMTVNPANAGFCVPAGNCLGSGVLNVSVCKQGAPIIMSSPHFYQGDRKFVQDVFGMNPKKEHHETTIDIHPLTGIILQAAKRLQINVYIEKIPTFSPTGNVRTVVFPVVYLNESVVIDDASVLKLGKIVVEDNVMVNVPFILIGLGVVLGIIFMFLMCRQKVPEVNSLPVPEDQNGLLQRTKRSLLWRWNSLKPVGASCRDHAECGTKYCREQHYHSVDYGQYIRGGKYMTHIVQPSLNMDAWRAEHCSFFATGGRDEPRRKEEEFINGRLNYGGLAVLKARSRLHEKDFDWRTSSAK